GGRGPDPHRGGRGQPHGRPRWRRRAGGPRVQARPPRRGERGVPGPAGQVRAGPPPLVPNAAYLDLLVRNSRLVPNAAYLELLVARPSEASAAHLDLLVRDGRKDRPARGQARRSAWRAAWRATG
ncbi:unnamed protein product, partial [Prorocentrum cordatum]